MHTIAFYNLENFFDVYDDPQTMDDDFTPKGIMHWIKKRYDNKTHKIAKTIGKIGKSETGFPPAIIGLAEVENQRVLKDLIRHPLLKKYHYQFIHYESHDVRGMDVALLYRPQIFQITEKKVFPIELYNNQGQAYPTRDILYCKGDFCEKDLHIFVNHWPSRREGDLESNQKRKLAAMRLSEQINFIQYEEDFPNIIVLGDFNTQPDDENIQTEIISLGFFNPTIEQLSKKNGSTVHSKKWLLFDQIIFSKNFLSPENSCQYLSFHVFKPGFLLTWKGKFRNFPFRTYSRTKYKNGYSDHLPVYAILKNNKH